MEENRIQASVRNAWERRSTWVMEGGREGGKGEINKSLAWEIARHGLVWRLYARHGVVWGALFQAWEGMGGLYAWPGGQ